MVVSQNFAVVIVVVDSFADSEYIVDIENVALVFLRSTVQHHAVVGGVGVVDPSDVATYLSVAEQSGMSKDNEVMAEIDHHVEDAKHIPIELEVLSIAVVVASFAHAVAVVAPHTNIRQSQ